MDCHRVGQKQGCGSKNLNQEGHRDEPPGFSDARGRARFISLSIFFLIIFLTVIFERERERQSVSGAGAEREGDADTEAGPRLPAVSTEPDAGLELTDREIMT